MFNTRSDKHLSLPSPRHGGIQVISMSALLACNKRSQVEKCVTWNQCLTGLVWVTKFRPVVDLSREIPKKKKNLIVWGGKKNNLASDAGHQFLGFQYLRGTPHQPRANNVVLSIEHGVAPPPSAPRVLATD